MVPEGRRIVGCCFFQMNSVLTASAVRCADRCCAESTTVVWRPGWTRAVHDKDKELWAIIEPITKFYRNFVLIVYFGLLSGWHALMCGVI